METRAIESGSLSNGLAAQQGQVSGGQLGESFAVLLNQLLGVSNPSGMYGAINPMEFAPAPVGTEVIVKPKETIAVEDKSQITARKQELVEEDDSEVTTEKDKEEKVFVANSEEEVVAVLKEETAVVEEVAVAEVETVAVAAEVATDLVAKPTEVVEVAARQQVATEVQKEVVAENAIIDEHDAQTWVPQKAAEGTVKARGQVEFSSAEELDMTEWSADDGASLEPKVLAAIKNAVAKPESAEATRESRMVGTDQPLDTAVDLSLLEAQKGAATANSAELPRNATVVEAFRTQMVSMLRPEGAGDSAFSAARPNAGAVPLAAVGASDGKGANSDSADKARAAKQTQQIRYSDQDKIIAQVQEMLKSASQSQSGNTLVMRLDPPELGSMMVRVTSKAGQLFARIVPESPEVEAALRNRAAELVQVLAVNGINFKDVHVSIGAERSETEMFQFGQFMENHNGGSGQFDSHDHAGGEAPPENFGRKQEKAPDAPGWVA